MIGDLRFRVTGLEASLWLLCGFRLLVQASKTIVCQMGWRVGQAVLVVEVWFQFWCGSSP